MEESIKPRKIYYREFKKAALPNKEVVIRFFLNAYIVKDFEAVKNLLSDNYFDHGPCKARSNIDCVNILKENADLYEDMRLDILQIIEEQNLVSTLVRFSFVHSKDLFGFKATNKRIVFDALENFRLKDGKISESWGNWPMEQIVKQLKN